MLGCLIFIGSWGNAKKQTPPAGRVMPKHVIIVTGENKTIVIASVIMIISYRRRERERERAESGEREREWAREMERKREEYITYFFINFDRYLVFRYDTGFPQIPRNLL